MTSFHILTFTRETGTSELSPLQFERLWEGSGARPFLPGFFLGWLSPVPSVRSPLRPPPPATPGGESRCPQVPAAKQSVSRDRTTPALTPRPQGRAPGMGRSHQTSLIFTWASSPPASPGLPVMLHRPHSCPCVTRIPGTHAAPPGTSPRCGVPEPW